MRCSQPIQTLTGHQDWVESVAFSPDGKMLASGSWDRTIALWDVAEGKPVRTLADRNHQPVGKIAGFWAIEL
ncbi:MULTISPECIES: WD40 domain-containing protein [unclassified Microcoleus]|uniref:WD40 domain-containing protein n=1 Tax=unclassified Microcoleus TaxID=2642155 RepID=UPI002FD6A469